ncbi:sugar transferase [Streptomyces sp. NPDC058405]|uniref:sugar transferase n=1 Tax=Streptomyces sp. NPDC058405 TaxID=3346482 RepID=UPI003650CE10
MKRRMKQLFESKRLPEPKRLLDLALGSALLVLAAPVLMAATLTVALTRPAGGVFVREYRTGLNGRPFVLSSLRTRLFRLDLLSRLPHVVRGELSLVGPAPLKVGSPAAAAPWRRLVRPGLTGLAQVRRHSPLPWDEAPLLDQHYVEQHWIGLDLAILVRTLPALCAAHARSRARSETQPRAWLFAQPFARSYAQSYARPCLPAHPRALPRARARAFTPRGEGALSDTDHRLRRYIAAR